MANDTVKMPVFFEACLSVLEEAVVPIHYVRLTELALEKLEVPKDSVNWQRQIEDLREKLADAGRLGCVYTGEPLCLVFLLSWVRREDTPHLFNNEKPVVIEANFPASEEACFEALMRQPYMLTKTSAPLERRNRGLARGMLIEHHVKSYFRTRWLEYYVPPENEGNWRKPCDHDFKLMIGLKLRKVDVAGEHMDGTFGLSAGKRPTTMHVMARRYGNSLVLEGFKPGTQFAEKDQVEWWDSMAIQPLVCYLNCQKAGIDYSALQAAVSRKPRF
jgi:hypothetical protein